MLKVNKTDLSRHYVPRTVSDRVASAIARFLSWTAGVLFGRRYGDRMIVLETVAAVLPMATATLLHLKCLRRMIDDRGWVRTFMDEAESQRAHLMAFVALARPRWWERLLIVAAQGVFYNFYFLLYLISARTAHRLAGYVAEQAVSGYSDFIERSGADAERAAPPFAIDYWTLDPDARLTDMIEAIRSEEAIHRDIHHAFADALAAGADLPDRSGPLV